MKPIDSNDSESMNYKILLSHETWDFLSQLWQNVLGSSVELPSPEFIGNPSEPCGTEEATEG
jgi:hypothetical protein